jgi:hypothetical protein
MKRRKFFGLLVAPLLAPLVRLPEADANPVTMLVDGRLGVHGGSGPSADLVLQSTSNASKGRIMFGSSVYDESTGRFGIRS